MTNPLECKNTDRELWRGPDEGNGDFYADSIHVTENGGIGINCGGYVIVKPLREWHRLAASPSLANEKEGEAASTDGKVLERVKLALEKITQLRYVEDVNEPFDEAIDLADVALAIINNPSSLSPAPASKGPMEATIERIAKALYIDDRKDPGAMPWEKICNYNPDLASEFRSQARAALGAMQHE